MLEHVVEVRKALPAEHPSQLASEPRIYQYAPLRNEDSAGVNQREFRVLHLLPATRVDEVIRIDIMTVSLDPCPLYEALSYVWGPSEPSERIWIGEGYIEIGPNLKNALRHLRYTDQARTLWIDRLAIDQSNVREREDQVTLMGKIYGLASKVIVWLGDADARSRLALKTIEDIAARIARHHAHQALTQQNQDSRAAEDLYHDFRPGSSQALAVQNLLRRAWFGRVWTFQEIVLARHADVQCGDASISWNSIQNFLAGLQVYRQGFDIESNALDGADNNAMLMVHARAAQELDLKSDASAQNALLGFMPLLDGMRNYGATDPRDRVYALLNVAVDIGEPLTIAVDYGQSIMEVYATATKWLIQKWRTLAVLSLVETKDDVPLISWVPDFRSKDPMNFWRQPALLQRPLKNRIYQACGNTEAEIRAESLFRLHVRGIFVGTITQHTEPSGNIRPPNIAFGPNVVDGGSWQLFARSVAPDGLYRPTQESIDIAFERIRIADILPGEEVTRTRRSQPLETFPRLVPERYSYVQVNGMGSFNGPTNDIGANILRATFRRRMFCTNTGYLGLGHRSLQVGDEVFVLFGADVPFVLRKINERAYILRGDAYVHGVMDGELVDMMHSGSEPDSRMGVVDITLF